METAVRVTGSGLKGVGMVGLTHLCRASLAEPEDVLLESYWRNLYAACSQNIKVSYAEFRKRPWFWLGRYGRGEVGGAYLPLLPRQVRLQVNEQ